MDGDFGHIMAKRMAFSESDSDRAHAFVSSLTRDELQVEVGPAVCTSASLF